MWAVRVRGRYFNDRQPSGLNNISTAVGGGGGGGLMHGIKIPQQDFALKMQGRGGAYLRDTTYSHGTTYLSFCSLTFCSLRNNKISADGVLVLAGALIVNRNLKLE